MAVLEALATTLKNREREMGDAILNHNALTMFLLKNGKMADFRGGEKIYETLEIAENDTAAWYTQYGTFTLGQPNEVITAAEYDVAQLGGFAAISGLEESKNRGKYAAVELAGARKNVLKKTLQNKLAASVFNDGTEANAIDGLQFLVADDPTAAGTPAGINQVTQTNWQNKTSGDVAITAANIVDEMQKMDIALRRGQDAPDLWVANAVAFQMYWKNVSDIQRVADKGTAESAAGLGFKMLKFNGQDFIFDGNCPDGTGSGAVTKARIYALNTDTMKLRCDPSRRFAVGDVQRIQNADYKACPVWFIGALTTNDRARNGVIYHSAAV